MKIDPEFDRVAARVKRIKWAGSAGHAIPEQLASTCRSVGSVEEALRLLSGDEWDAWSSEMRGNLTAYLDGRHHTRFQDWNATIRKAKEAFAPIDAAVAQGLERSGLLGADAHGAVRWDIVGSLACAAFMDCRPPVDTLRLLEIYEAGHIPVGADSSRKLVLVF